MGCNMRIRLTLSQLKKILQTEEPKYPVVFQVGNLNVKEFLELSKLFQEKERG